MREPAAGARLGRYRLVAPIGTGGMGRVWAALDEAAPSIRLVAVKIALNTHGADPKYWETLSDEASVASRIEHPNVCATYELGVEADVHFLVMEWSDGTSLRDLLDAAPGQHLPLEIATYIGAQVAAGLHAAHELCDAEGRALGVVHRDVSPQNVLISMQGHVRLADFGVAKAKGQQRRATETGEVKGKLSYMAPEQISSREVDRRADVFALGCLVYEAALGQRAFHGNDALSTMYKILEEDVVPPRAINPDFPEALELVLLKALRKNPAERYETAEQLRDALLGFLASSKRPVIDRHIAKILSGSLGESLLERNRDLRALAERLRRGESIASADFSAAPRGTVTPGGMERSAGQTGALRAPVSWIQVGLGGAVLIAAAFTVLVVASPRERRPAAAQPPVAATLAAAVPATNAGIAPAATPAASAHLDSLSGTAAAEPSALPARARPAARAKVAPPVAGLPEAAPPRPLAPDERRLTKPVPRPPRTIDQSNPFAASEP